MYELNVETRRWLKCKTVTWFTGDTIRDALHKFYTWVRYMEEQEYSIQPTSVSYGDKQLLVVYRFKDHV